MLLYILESDQRKGGVLFLAEDGHTYRKVVQRGDRINVCCTHKLKLNCRATAVVKMEWMAPGVLEVKGIPHCHEPIDDPIQRLKKQILDECEKITPESIRDIFDRITRYDLRFSTFLYFFLILEISDSF